MGRYDNAQRTTHTRTGHNGRGLPRGSRAHPEPAWGVGADGPPPNGRGQAADEDRRTRAAYPGQVLRSPYLGLVALPDEVAPRDFAHAHSILCRVEEALAVGERGRWTPLERRRLRDMRDAWERRASGCDASFNLVGWSRTLRFDGARGRWVARARARNFARLIDTIREALD